MTITTQSAKAKGRKLQQKFASLILSTFKTLEPDDARSCSMGSNGEDVQLSPAARKLFPYSIECKKRSKIGVFPFYAQAKSNARGHEPLVVIEQDRSATLVIVSAEHFMSLVANQR